MYKKIFFLLLIPIYLNAVSYRLGNSNCQQGFFSIFHTVLGALDFYETNEECTGLVIDFGTNDYYYDPSYGSNWWEYYFEPIKLGMVDTVDKDFVTYKNIIFSNIGQFLLPLDHAHELINKYIKIKPAIQNKVDSFVQEHFDSKKVIGVHYRGTDKKSEAPKVPYEYVANLLKREYITDPAIYFFVATDDQLFLDFIKTIFPHKIIYIDALRSCDDHNVHSAACESPYKKGEQALMDCLLLSRCSKLYKTASHLSDCSIKFNPALPVVHICKSFFESNYYNFYHTHKTVGAIIDLLDGYEKKENEGFSVFLPMHTQENWWDQFFEPLAVGNKQLTQLHDYDLTVHALPCLFDMPRTRGNELFKKYLVFKPALQEKIKNFIQKYCPNKYILGAYFRKHELLTPIDNQAFIDMLKSEIAKINQDYVVLVFCDEALFFQDLINNNIYQIASPLLDKSLVSEVRGEFELLSLAILAHADKIIGAGATGLKLLGHMNADMPIIEYEKSWLEQ